MLGASLLGIYEKAFPNSMGWEDKVALASNIGFDFIELSIDESDQRLERLRWSQDKIKALREVAECYRISVQSICLSGHRRYPFGSHDPKIRATAREMMERAFEFAHEAGIPLIQLAGYDVYYESSSEQSHQSYLEALEWACGLAKDYQIKLAIETMDTSYVNSITKYLALRKHITSPWLSVYADVGNLSAWPENDVVHELMVGGDNISQIHLKETIKGTDVSEPVFRDVPFGTGSVDFSTIFNTLDAMGYTNPFTIEMWHNAQEDVCTQIEAAKHYIEQQYVKGVGK